MRDVWWNWIDHRRYLEGQRRFDEIAFKDHGDWAFCYCLEGHLDRKTQEKRSDPEEPEVCKGYEKKAEIVAGS